MAKQKKEGEEICGRIDHSPSGRKRRENEDSCAVCVRALSILEEKNAEASSLEDNYHADLNVIKFLSR